MTASLITDMAERSLADRHRSRRPDRRRSAWSTLALVVVGALVARRLAGKGGQ
jgi:hypothetical protein